MWDSIKRAKRCIIVAQGYYEWLKKGKDRISYFIKHKDRKLILFAGLYDCARLQGLEKPLWSFTIVTTSANNEFCWLHDRQPVILSSHQAITTWLDTSRQSWTSELSKLVEPYNDSTSSLQCYPVPKEVGKVGMQSSTFIEPDSERKDGIQAMFAKQQNASPYKRKRTSSAAAELSDQKKIKVEENDPDIQYLGTMKTNSKSTTIETKSPPPKPKLSSQPRTKPKPAPLPEHSSSVPKITDFFKH